ncbi:S8 family serine peptidase [Bacillus sp. DJP31]|uniref:S8 family serine peptidase n=1 Tax=Bacillus sp. DJP31 TaxID=3409789 RepID=UPI003BB5E84E
MSRFVNVFSLSIMLVFLTVPGTYALSDLFTFPLHPPLPEIEENQIQSVIVSTDKLSKEEVLRKVKNLSSVSLKTEFETAFNGFSLTGTKEDIEQIRQMPGVENIYPNQQYKATIERSVPYIGAEEIRSYLDVHDHRLTGEGIKVGIIDTGIDYSHPDLRRNFKGGYDLVDQDRDPMETKSKQGLPTMHGTHVAGIIAANGKIQGVAPKSEIIAYRALGPGGMGTSEQVIAAIEKAIVDKVDIINLSLGNDVNGPDWPTSIALNKAVEKGIVAVTSSGNSGPKMWTVGSPGTAQKAISVGASTPPIMVPFLTMGSNKSEIELTPMQGAKPWDFSREEKLVDAGKGFLKDFTENVKGNVALVERGTIPFTEKVANAVEKGAIGVIIYNNVKGNFAGALEIDALVPVVSISKEDGDDLKSSLLKTNYIQTSFKKIEDSMADFSSRGPVTYTWDIKPDVVAPGVNIKSTIPNGYESLQGTSMAAPHVAGAAALIKQSHLDWNPDQIKAALMNTAKRLSNEKGYYSPIEQGAGRIQIDKAVRAETLVYPGSFSFGMFHNEETRKEKKVTITIDNQSNEEKTYSFELPKSENGLQWKLPSSLSIPPKQQKKVTVSLDITPSIIKEGIHSNWLTIYEEGNPIHLPYIFVIEEPDYPRIMGFQFGQGDSPETYLYEAYLPGGAEEFGIALYDPDTFRFIKYLDFAKDVSRGIVKKQLTKEEIGLKGVYKGLVFAKNKGREDTIEVTISINESTILEKK